MGFTLLPWLAPQICRILGFCKGLFKGLERDTVNWQTLVNMQAAIKVGLYPSNDVISWTDSLGVAFQATPGLVSCTPTEGQSHLRVFFFFRFFVHFQWLVANYHTAPAPHCAGTAINKTSWVSKRLWKNQSTCGQMTYNQMYLHRWSSGWPAV